MASCDPEKKAKEAFIDDHFELAVDLYTQAIQLSPTSAELFADRAQANIKLQNFTEAVVDANKAIELNHSMAKAYLRKGVACIKLEEYQTAKVAFEIGASLAPTDSRFTKFIKECDEAEEFSKELAGKAPSDVTPNNLQSVVSLLSQGAATTMSTTKSRYRHEFYQKPEEVVVTIFVKAIPANSVVVDFGEQILSVTIELPGEETDHFQPRLFGKIIPARCRYTVMSTKIEVRLAKADSAHWTSLEFNKDVTVVPRANISSGNPKPIYPSSKPKRVDWDKLEAQMKKEVESHGTVLSTNWKEVGVKKVEGSPPDGMELKKWEY